jgi:hypothetical protein
MMNNIFDRLRPPAIKKKQEISPPQALLNFLQRWPRDLICLRDLRIFGPRMVRAEQSVIDSSIALLIRHSHLAVAPSHRRDRHVWKIIRRPVASPIITSQPDDHAC